MCESCPAHLPGPGEVAGGALGLAVGAALTKPGRKVLVGFCYLMLPFAVWGELHWWTLALVAMAMALAGGGLVVMRKLHRHAVVQHDPTPQMRAALAARGLKQIPAPGVAQPALPRAFRRRLAQGRPAVRVPAPRTAQSLSAPKVIEATRVIPPGN